MNSKILPIILGALLALVAVRYAGRERIDGVLGSIEPTVKPITAQTQPRVIYSADNPQPAYRPIVRPVEQPTPVGQYPDCATVKDTKTACTNTANTALAEPATECWQGSFYTCEELAEMGDSRAIDAVRATDKFLDTNTLPTPEPAFVEYTQSACAAASVKSILCP